MLDFESWLQMQTGSGLSLEEFIALECAESGADREMCFDIETEQDRRYSLYVDIMEK